MGCAKTEVKDGDCVLLCVTAVGVYMVGLWRLFLVPSAATLTA